MFRWKSYAHTACVVTAVLTVSLVLSSHRVALPLTGADTVSADDIGAKASVVLYDRNNRFYCGGTAVADSFIVTAAHCFAGPQGRSNPQDWRVYYGTAVGKGTPARGVKIAVHENYAGQVRAAQKENAMGYWIPRLWDDIALMRINGTHPAGVVSAHLPEIDNGYTSTKGTGDTPEGDNLWYYLYGYSANGRVQLQRALAGQYRPLWRVFPGKESSILPFQYNSQSFFIIFSDDGPEAKISICAGDSGSGVFLVNNPDRLSYSSDSDREVPKGIQLKDGRPVLIAIMTATSTNNLRAAPNCALGTDNRSIYAVRTDYYHDWLVAKMRQMQ